MKMRKLTLALTVRTNMPEREVLRCIREEGIVEILSGDGQYRYHSIRSMPKRLRAKAKSSTKR